MTGHCDLAEDGLCALWGHGIIGNMLPACAAIVAEVQQILIAGARIFVGIGDQDDDALRLRGRYRYLAVRAGACGQVQGCPVLPGIVRAPERDRVLRWRAAIAGAGVERLRVSRRNGIAEEFKILPRYWDCLPVRGA